MTDIRRLLDFIRTGFNQRSETDPAFRASVAGFNKTIFFSIEDASNYCFSVQNGYVPEIVERIPLRYDIKVTTDTENLLALLSGKLDPMHALVGRKMRVAGSLQDIAWMKKFLAMNKSEISHIMKDFETRN